jgi:hypothetical protein
MTTHNDILWAKAGTKAKARTAAVRAPIDSAHEASVAKGVAAISFASKAAEDLAIAEGLQWPEVDGFQPESKMGLTIADVRKILGARKE